MSSADFKLIGELDIGQIMSQVIKLQKEFAKLGVDLGKIGQVPGMQKFDQAVNQVNSTMSKTNKILDEVNSKINKVGAAGEDAGKKTGRGFGDIITKAATWGLAFRYVYTAIRLVENALKENIKTMIDFDYSIRELNVTFEGNLAVTTKLSKEILDLGISYGYTAQESMKIAIDWAKAGKTQNEVIDLTKTTLAAMRGEFMSADIATKALMVTMTAFNIPSKDSMTIIDKLGALSKKYATNADELAQALQRVAYTAKQSNLTLDETLGLITGLSEVTRRSGSHVGVSESAILTKLRSPKALKAFQGMGVDVYDQNQQLRPMIAILKDLEKWWGKANDKQKDYVAQAVSGGLRMNDFKAILESLDIVVKATETSMASAGTTMRDSNEMMEATKVAWDKLKTEFSAIFTVDTGWLTELINKFAALTRGIRETIHWWDVWISKSGAKVAGYREKLWGPEVSGELISPQEKERRRLEGLKGLVGKRKRSERKKVEALYGKEAWTMFGPLGEGTLPKIAPPPSGAPGGAGGGGGKDELTNLDLINTFMDAYRLKLEEAREKLRDKDITEEEYYKEVIKGMNELSTQLRKALTAKKITRDLYVLYRSETLWKQSGLDIFGITVSPTTTDEIQNIIEGIRNISKFFDDYSKIESEFNKKVQNYVMEYKKETQRTNDEINDILSSVGLSPIENLMRKKAEIQKKLEGYSRVAGWVGGSVQARLIPTIGPGTTPEELERELDLLKEKGKISEEEMKNYMDLYKEYLNLKKEEVKLTQDILDKQRELARSIRDDFFGPMKDYMMDWSQTSQEMFANIGKNIQGRGLTSGFEAINKIIETKMGGGLANIMAFSQMSPAEQAIISGHTRGGQIVYDSMVRAGAVAGREIAQGMKGGQAGAGLSPVAQIEEMSKLAQFVNSMSGGGGGGVNLPKGQAGAGGGGGGIMGWFNNLKQNQQAAIGYGLSGALGMGTALAGGVPPAQALIGNLPSIGGMVGTLASTVPLAGPVGMAVGTIASLVGRFVMADMESGSQTSKQININRQEMSSRFDTALKKLDISNRYLADIRNSMTTYAMPSSYYFRERAGTGLQNQTVTVRLQLPSGESAGSITISNLAGQLQVQGGQGIQ